MANVISSYGKKAQHCEIASPVIQVEEEKAETANIVMIEPPLGGQKSYLQYENDGSLCVDCLLNVV